jgi:hypothetical protein
MDSGANLDSRHTLADVVEKESVVFFQSSGGIVVGEVLGVCDGVFECKPHGAETVELVVDLGVFGVCPDGIGIIRNGSQGERGGHRGSYWNGNECEVVVRF